MNSILPAPHFTPLFLMAVFACWITSSGSQCNPDEVKICKEAGTKGGLQGLYTGGTCEEKAYVHYTHTCQLNTQLYDPDVSSCCCRDNRRIMCCKYKQVWNVFRCSQADDTVDNISPLSRPPGASSGFKTPKWYILAAIIAVPLLLIGCCVLCVVKCCCQRGDPAAKTRLSGSQCMSCCKEHKQKDTLHSNGPVSMTQSDVESSSQARMMTSQYSTESRGSEAKLLPDEADEALDSAHNLPYTTNKSSHSHSGYRRLASSSSGVLAQIPEQSVQGSSQNTRSKELPPMDAQVSIPSAPPGEEEVDFTCPSYPEGCTEVFTASGHTGGAGMGHVFIENGGGNVEEMASRGHRTPSVGYMSCPPPAYGDHHRDKVLS